MAEKFYRYYSHISGHNIEVLHQVLPSWWIFVELRERGKKDQPPKLYVVNKIIF